MNTFLVQMRSPHELPPIQKIPRDLMVELTAAHRDRLDDHLRWQQILLRVGNLIFPGEMCLESRWNDTLDWLDQYAYGWRSGGAAVPTEKPQAIGRSLGVVVNTQRAGRDDHHVA